MLKPWAFQEGSLVLSALNLPERGSRSGQAFPASGIRLHSTGHLFQNHQLLPQGPATSTLRSEKLTVWGK